MGVRATTGACAPEDEKVVGKGLCCRLRPLNNYHMAVKIVLLCVNIPVFPGGDSDLESTVHSPVLASQKHTRGWGWTTRTRELT